MENVRITVNSRTFRFDPLRLENLTELQQISWSLANAVCTVNDIVCLSIHHHIHALPSLQKRTVEDEILALSVAHSSLRRMFQPVVYNATDRRPAVSTLPDQLPDRITFSDPSLEPHEQSSISAASSRPAERCVTCKTQPPLFTIASSTVPLDSSTLAPRANTFFTMMIKPFLSSIYNPLTPCN